MKNLEICPQTIHMFECDLELLNEIKYYVEREDYKINSNKTNYRSVDAHFQKKKIYEKCVNWVNDCLDEVKTLYNYECEKLSITQMWANKTEYRGWHHGHIHPYSIVSGIFYITESNSQTWFTVEDHWKKVSQSLFPIGKMNPYAHVITKINTCPGKLIIFPSNLYHSVNEHMIEKNPRYSISFNTFPSGVVGNLEHLIGLKLQIL